MNTYVHHLQTILSSGFDKEKVTCNEAQPGDNVSSFPARFMPVPCTDVAETDLPVWRVQFEVLNAESPVDICLEINGNIILGVEDTKTGFINLADYYNHVRGVSRHHLKISPTGSDLWMVDLESTNGTRKNGRVVQPNTPYSIYHGDILELGNLTLAINIARAPVDHVKLAANPSTLADALTHISTLLTSNLNPDAVLDRVLETAASLCKADEVALLLWDQNAHEFSLCRKRGMPGAQTLSMRIPVAQEHPLNGVLQMGKPLRDNPAPGRKSEIITGYPVEAALYAPVPSGDAMVGVLVALQRQKGKAFSAEDERLLCTMAKFSSIAIQNSQKDETTNLNLQKKVEELSSYNQILHALAKTNNLTGIYGVLREHIRQHWDVDNVGLWLADQATKKLTPFPKPTFHRSYCFGEDLIGSVASRAEPILATDIRLFSEPTKSPEPTLQLVARSAICVPIMENNTVMGVLAVFSKKENEFQQEDLQPLQTLSLATAAALRNVWLFEQVDKQRATVLAAVNMLPHPVMIFDHDEKIIVSNRAADTLLNEIHSSKNGGADPNNSGLMPLISLMNGLSKSKWCTREIIVGDKVYVATLEYASMVGTIILMQDVTDPVTGTCNRSYFHDLAEQAFRQAKRYVKPLAALVIGSEGLEHVIHEKGYAVGNQILKEMAVHLRGLLRTPDILGRHQNDKFVVVLPETTLDNATVVAERIVNSLKTSVFAQKYKASLTITIGATALDTTNDDSIDVLIEKAHKAYASTNADKRSRIKVYEETGDYQLFHG